MLFLGAPLGVPAVSPRYWHHMLQPAHTTQLSAADGSVPTRHRLPPTYCIAEDGESHSMDLPQANITAVSAWTKTDAAWCVSSEHCDENGGGMQSVEVASTLSHLKAVATAWADGVQAALIVEESASFAHVDAWPLSLQQLASRAPADWDALVLDADDTERPLSEVWSELFVAAEHDGGSRALHPRAYLINRAGMERLLNTSSYVSSSLLQAPGVSAAHMSTNRSWRGSGGAFAAAVLDASTARTADAAALPRVTDGNGRRVDQDGRLVFDQDGRRAVRLPADGVLSELKAYRVAAPMMPRESTVALADGFYAKLKACDPSNSSRNGCKPPPAPLSIAILATVFTSDRKRHLANLDVLGESKEVRWTYAINAMDNDVGKWPRAAFVDRGVYFAAQASGRVEGTFQPRLLSQLPFTEALLDAVHLDYVWLIDGDISMKPLDIPALAASLPSATIGQTTINSAMSRHPTAGGNEGQYFYFLNTPTAEEARKRCGLTLLAVPFIEIQAPLLSTEFFAWYAPELREIAALQKREGSAWGPDTLWCGAAHRYAAARKEAAPPYPCAVLPTAVYHDDTRTIDKGGDFVARGQRTVAALQASHSRDYVGANEANGWWNSISWNCSRLNATTDAFESFRKQSWAAGFSGSATALFTGYY